ncbi:MAG: M23 family metallopeptidase [Microbacteriaceae bacterium]|nr:M23 family metallopeptidase [Microbacteriaceae bacterium]
MPKPVLLIAGAAARSKTVRRLVVGAVAVGLMLTLSLATPLLAVPLMLSGSGATAGGSLVVGEWGYPLAGDYNKGRGFGWHPVEGCAYCSKDHKGYDMDQPCGATVYATGPGRVVRAGPWDSFGNAVEIDHGGGVVTVYGHMQWDSLYVTEGSRVVAGTPLGLEGTTGVSTGCHVHFEIRVDGVPVDPEPFMAALGLPLK